jgi:hypothetical protein
MDRRLILASALGVLTVPALAQTPSSPVDAVKRVYDPKVKDAQRPYSARLKRLYAAAQKKSRQINEPVSGLDFDPTISAQDSDDDFRKTLRYDEKPATAEKAVIEVHFILFKGQPQTVLTYELVREGNAWMIDDIVNPAKTYGWRWSKMLEAGAKGQ